MKLDSTTHALLLCFHLHFALGSLDGLLQTVMLKTNDSSTEPQLSETRVPQIAIIGAGITGASAAHHLHQLARLHQPLDITVFESGDKVGGQIRSTYVHNEPAFDVECGASSFTHDDWCMKDAMQEVGLKLAHQKLSRYQVGVWDGQDLTVSYYNDGKPLDPGWRQFPKWLWRYGTSLSSLQKLILDRANRFSGFGELRSYLKLSSRLMQLFPRDDFLMSASESFQKLNLNKQLLDEVVRPECRYRYARDLHEINALSATLSLRQAPDLAVYQGNQRLPHRMLKISEARTLLNTRVTEISEGESRRWKLHSQGTGVNELDTHSAPAEDEFDIVIITTELASSGITIDLLPSALVKAAKAPEYLARHVTLFSTLHQLSPIYFGLPANTTMPEKILTAPRNTVSSMKSEGNPIDDNVEEIGILGINVAKRVPPPDSGDCINEEEYVYRVVSSQPISDEEIAKLVGREKNSNETLDDLEVTWVHRQAWPHAYPKFVPGDQILDDIQIAPDLYYTSVAVQQINTMEMGCRMGLNLAKHLYYSKWVGEMEP